MRIRSSRVLLLLSLLAALCLSVVAQSDRGTITGTVQDSTGAVVVNAKIKAVDQATGETRNTISSASGAYRLPELKASTWTITVEAPGFKTTTYGAVKVAVGIVDTLNITLNVGATSESVTVEGGVQAIQTENASVQTNVTERQVHEMPLMVSAEFAGRTPLAFIFMDSNVTSSNTGSQQNSTTFRVNGGQALGADILIDGANTRRAQNGSYFNEVAPGPNAFQEFTYNTSSYSAEFGNSSAGVVNFTMKSGTNQLHGEAYEHFRNEALNANKWTSNNRATPLRKDRDREHDFGFNVGGPVYIPKLYDGRNKTFFFFNYNSYRFKQSENRLITIPTMKMRTGDFSELLTDPAVLAQRGGPVLIYDPHMDPWQRVAGTQIPGNRLDQYQNGALLDPVALKMMAAYPQPTSSGVFQNYLAQSTMPTNMDSEVVKIDQILTEKQRLSLSYSYRTNSRTAGGFPRMPAPAVATGVWDQVFKTHYARAQHDYTISPTMLNHFNIGWNRYWVENSNSTFGFDPRTLGINPNATANQAFPMIEYWDPGMGNDTNDARAVQGIGSTWWHDTMGDNMVQASDSFIWSLGKHTIKFGGDLRIQQLNMYQNFDNGGHFQFSNEQTMGMDGGGWNVASFATGAARIFWTTITTVKPAYRFVNHAYYINDDFKLTPRLTVNLGLRYEIQSPRTEARDYYRAFDPNAINPVVGIKGALVSAKGPGPVSPYRGLFETDKTDIAPRLGFAYSLNAKTAVRGGIGLYYAPFMYGAGGGMRGYRAGRDFHPDWNGYGGRGWMTPGAWLQSLPNAPLPDPQGQFIGDNVEYFQQDAKAGRTVQWNLDVQRELPGNFVVTTAYIGNKGTRLRSSLQRLNAAPVEALRLGYPLLTKNINDVTADERAYATSLGITLPANGNAVYQGFNGSVAQALRPFPQYNIIGNDLENLGQSWYNALNLKLDRRFSKGVQFTAAYTWSKLITNASDDLFGNSPMNGVLQNPFDRASLRSISPTNASQVFVFNYIVELPFGKKKPFLNKGGLLDKFVGGWQISGIHRYQSGLPIVPAVIGGGYRSFLDLMGYNGNLRPNLVGDPSKSYSTNGAEIYVLNGTAFSMPNQFSACPMTGTGPGAQCVAVSDPRYSAYYNVDPKTWFGNSPAVVNTRVLPYYSENFSILKKISVAESKFAEIGAEFFNPFNRHRYSMPDTAVDGNFGRSSVVDDPRVIQLRVRFVF